MEKRIFLKSHVKLATISLVGAMSSVLIMGQTVHADTPVTVDTSSETTVTDTGTSDIPVLDNGGATTPIDNTDTGAIDTPVTDPATNTENDGVNTETPTAPNDSGADTPIDGGTTPSDNGGTDSNDNSNQGDDKAGEETSSNNSSSNTSDSKNQTVWSEGDVSQSTGQVISPVTPEQPIVSDKGYEIVSTKNGKVVVSETNGVTREVEPEEVGGKRNNDGTISIKDSKGETKTLPETGSQTGVFVTIFGTLLMWFGLALHKRVSLSTEASKFSF